MYTHIVNFSIGSCEVKKKQYSFETETGLSGMGWPMAEHCHFIATRGSLNMQWDYLWQCIVIWLKLDEHSIYNGITNGFALHLTVSSPLHIQWDDQWYVHCHLTDMKHCHLTAKWRIAIWLKLDDFWIIINVKTNNICIVIWMKVWGSMTSLQLDIPYTSNANFKILYSLMVKVL